MILPAKHDEPSLAAQQKRQPAASGRPTSTSKNRVWGFENHPSGRSCSSPDLSRENATRSVQFSYEIASGRIEHYQYDPFGNVITQTGSLQQPYQWSSKETDASTGLVYYGLRFYSPALERWSNRDPLEEDGGINLYAFVSNDPINSRDLFGMVKLEAGVVGSLEADLNLSTGEFQIDGWVWAGVGFTFGSNVWIGKSYYKQGQLYHTFLPYHIDTGTCCCDTSDSSGVETAMGAFKTFTNVIGGFNEGGVLVTPAGCGAKVEIIGFINLLDKLGPEAPVITKVLNVLGAKTEAGVQMHIGGTICTSQAGHILGTDLHFGAGGFISLGWIPSDMKMK